MKHECQTCKYYRPFGGDPNAKPVVVKGTRIELNGHCTESMPYEPVGKDSYCARWAKK